MHLQYCRELPSRSIYSVTNCSIIESTLFEISNLEVMVKFIPVIT